MSRYNRYLIGLNKENDTFKQLYIAAQIQLYGWTKGCVQKIVLSPTLMIYKGK